MFININHTTLEELVLDQENLAAQTVKLNKSTETLNRRGLKCFETVLD